MPIWVDNSILRATECSTRTFLRYVHGKTTKGERAELLSGLAGHEALATHLRGGSKVESMAAFNGIYEEWARGHVGPDDRLGYKNVSDIVAHWIDEHPLAQLPYTTQPDWVEVPFELPLDEHGDIMFIGRLDAVAEMNHRIVVVEHKFTGRIDDKWQAKWRLDSQLSGYLYAMKYGQIGVAMEMKLLGKPISGVLINAIELSRLPIDDRKCAKHGVKYPECRLFHSKSMTLGEYPRDEVALQNWRLDALALAQKYLQLKEAGWEQLPNIAQEGMFYNSCQWCEFQDVCTTPRHPELIGAMLSTDHWDPRKFHHRDEKKEIPCVTVAPQPAKLPPPPGPRPSASRNTGSK